MPIQLWIWERRDNGDREVMGNSALELSRATRGKDGITSAKFYWYRADTVVLLTEGETAALDALPPVDSMAAALALADNAKGTLEMRLEEPRDALETYRSAGR